MNRLLDQMQEQFRTSRMPSWVAGDDDDVICVLVTFFPLRATYTHPYLLTYLLTYLTTYLPPSLPFLIHNFFSLLT